MDGILNKLRRAKYISKVDLKNAYFQVALDKEQAIHGVHSLRIRAVAI